MFRAFGKFHGNNTKFAGWSAYNFMTIAEIEMMWGELQGKTNKYLFKYDEKANERSRRDSFHS